jgi:hypothetical protein
METLDLETFKKFYEEMIALKEDCRASHEAWVTMMMEFIQQNRDKFCELTPVESKLRNLNV